MAHHDEVEGSIPVREGSEYKWVVKGTWNTKVEAFNEETGETKLIWSLGGYPLNKEW